MLLYYIFFHGVLQWDIQQSGVEDNMLWHDGRNYWYACSDVNRTSGISKKNGKWHIEMSVCLL